MKKIVALVSVLVFLGVNAQKKWSLKECVDYAVKNNLQVIGGQYTADIQQKNLQIAKRQYLPGVSGTFNNNTSFGQQQVGTANVRNDNYTNNASVSANMLLFNNGRLEKNIRKTNYDVEASLYDLQATQNNISLQIAQNYLSVMLNREIVKISQSALQNAQKLYDRAKITTDVGTTAKTVLAEAEASVAREKQNVKTAQVNTERSLFTLAQLLQLSDYQNFDVEDIPVPDSLSPNLRSVDDVLNQAYSTQPELKAAESRIKSSEAQTEVVKTSYWPTITASAGLSTFYYNSLNTNTAGINIDGTPIKESTLFKQYNTNFGQQMGINMSIPIFNKGITKLNVEQARINESVAKNNLELQKQTIRQNVQKAQFDSEANYQIYQSAIDTEKSTKLALDFAEKSYEAGRSTIYDLNIARNNYANALGSVAQAKYNYLFSLKVLDFYAGIPISQITDYMK